MWCLVMWFNGGGGSARLKVRPDDLRSFSIVNDSMILFYDVSTYRIISTSFYLQTHAMSLRTTEHL